MHKNEALPCPAGLDPASHPVDAVGTQRVALGHTSMGLRVEARQGHERKHFQHPAKVLSSAYESIFSS